MKTRRSLTLLCLLSWMALQSPLAAHAEVLEQSYTDSLAQFKVSTPSARWKLSAPGSDPGSDRVAIRFESAVNQFVPNVTVRVEALLDPKSKLEDFCEEETKKLPEKIQLLGKKSITSHGVKGCEVQMKDSEHNFIFYQWVFFSKGKSYFLTCTSKEESFPLVQSDFMKILNSFEFL